MGQYIPVINYHVMKAYVGVEVQVHYSYRRPYIELSVVSFMSQLLYPLQNGPQYSLDIRHSRAILPAKTKSKISVLD